MQSLLKNKIKNLINLASFYLSRSKKRRKILIAFIPTVGLFGFIINYFAYTSILNKTKTFFKTQFEEKVESNILMTNSWFKNFTNSLAYEMENYFSKLPVGVNLDNYILQKSGSIYKNHRDEVKEIVFVDFKKRECKFLYPSEKRGSYRNLYRITDRSNLVIKKSLSKNFFYVYIPNPKTEQVDSTIWGMISQTVKIGRRTVGRIIFFIDVEKIIGQKVSINSEGINTYKLFLTSSEKFDSLSKNPGHFIKWDNAILELKFIKTPMAEIPWVTRYRTVRKYLLLFSLIVGLLGFIAFSAAIVLFVGIGSIQEKEIDELHEQSKILNFIIGSLKNSIQNVTVEEVIIIGLKSLKELRDVDINVWKGNELIFSTDGGGEQELNCNTTFFKNMDRLCKEVQIEREKFRIHLKFKEFIDEKDFIFYSILIDVIAFAANFSNEYSIRRSIESNTFKSILKLLGAKDNYTCNHSVSVSEIATYIAREIGIEKFGLNEYDIEVIRIAGLLHDIGKMGVPDEILNKLGRYIDAEMEFMKLHPKFTEMILRPLAKYVDFYKDVLDVAVHHHERLDGSGYPYGLRGEAFRIQMQILAVADILDAMMRDRPYKKAKNDEEVIEELRAMISGPKENWKFNPELIEAVIAKFHEIKHIPDKINKDFCEIDIE